MPNSSSQPIKYLFVDGAYLDSGLEKFSRLLFKGDPIEINYDALRANYKRVFYYNSLPGQRQGETKDDFENRIIPQRAKLNEISRIKGFHLREGVIRRENRKKIQKKVDILIAVDMLSYTIAHNMDSATLLTGDLDFQPVLDALVQAGMYTTLLYFPDNTSDDLISSADESHPITIHILSNWLTSEFISKHPMPNGVSSQSDEPIKNARLIRKGKTHYGDDIFEYQDGKDFILTYPDVHNRPLGYKIYLKHSDEEFLQQYIKLAYGPFSWD